ncbi:hypothetical protein G9464_07010 [Halostella sp. JP-L12]|uniref:DUF7548 family protein n=1 Tax=Halostella TaxID=1843185 RepID=UPI000EF7D150|nr:MULTISPECIES: hypothetical protein [Halostella]NHN47344.1 hypothetical protein [Halostella sp. JP-L12]
MVDETVPPSVGLLGALAVVAAAVLPYVALPSADVSGLQVYYGYGLVGPWGVTLLAVVVGVAFAAGRQDRTPPEVAAGATVGLGVVMVLLALQWAFAVDETVVFQLSTAEWIEYHRWAFAAVTLLVPASGGWYARALRLI